MTETTIALKLPVCRVLLGDATTPPPNWLAEQHRQMVLLTSDQLQRWNAKHPPSAKAAERDEQQVLLQQKIDALDQAAAQLREAAKIMRQRWEQIVLPEMTQITTELAHAIAGKLVADKVLAGQFPIENIVQEVVERLNTDGPVVVKLHPDDLAVWHEHAEQHVSRALMDDNIRMQADANMARGDCQATGGEVSIIYELRRQIEELRHQLLS